MSVGNVRICAADTHRKGMKVASGRNLLRSQETWQLLLTSQDRAVLTYALNKALQDPFILAAASRQIVSEIIIALGRMPDVEEPGDHVHCACYKRGD